MVKRLSGSCQTELCWRLGVGQGVRKLFLLSPAKITGERAKWLLNPEAKFALARQFHREGLPLAEVFTFASGLYFRGKITYARQFARKEHGDIIRVITTNRGLVDPELHLRPKDLHAFGADDIHETNTGYHTPLRRDAAKLAKNLLENGVAILLGSIATAKYREVLVESFGPKLVFPSDFVGRGDMSRGALLLRASRDNLELPYTSVLGATYRGKRAPRVGEK